VSSEHNDGCKALRKAVLRYQSINVTSQLYDRCWNWHSACNSCYWLNQMLTVLCRLVTFFVVVALFQKQNDYILSSLVDHKIQGPEIQRDLLRANRKLFGRADRRDRRSSHQLGPSGHYNFRSVSPQEIFEQLLWSDFVRYVLSTTVAYHVSTISPQFILMFLTPGFPSEGFFEKAVNPSSHSILFFFSECSLICFVFFSSERHLHE
jgi:hypothetical protein